MIPALLVAVLIDLFVLSCYNEEKRQYGVSFMDFLLLNDAQKKEYRTQIFDIMLACDKDFVPPLSARFSTADTNFSAQTGAENGINAYFEDMMGEHVLAAVENGVLLGFVTYKEDYTCPQITKSTFPNLYICTLLLSPAARGRGLTTKMYAYLFDVLCPTRNLFTRTWSTNHAHIKILTRLGFDLIARLENDRGDGIDTVFYGKKRV